MVTNYASINLKHRLEACKMPAKSYQLITDGSWFTINLSMYRLMTYLSSLLNFLPCHWSQRGSMHIHDPGRMTQAMMDMSA